MCRSSLKAAMAGADAVIIATGYSGSLLKPGGFKKIDQEVSGNLLALHAPDESSDCIMGRGSGSGRAGA